MKKEEAATEARESVANGRFRGEREDLSRKRPGWGLLGNLGAEGIPKPLELSEQGGNSH